MKVKTLIDIGEGETIVVAARPGMGKTTFALKQAEDYIRKTGKEVLFISSVLLGDFQQKILDGMSEEIKAKIHVFEEVYRFADDRSFEVKYVRILSQNKSIGLVILDELYLLDSRFPVLNLTQRYGVSALCVTRVKRSAERRKAHIPKLRDVETKGIECGRVYILYREDYYDLENGDDTLQLIKLEKSSNKSKIH